MVYCNSNKEAPELSLYELKKIKVCNKRDFMSTKLYKSLIQENKHLPFFEEIEDYTPKQQGTIIRWLYRGLSLIQACEKVKEEIRISKFMKSRYRKW